MAPQLELGGHLDQPYPLPCLGHLRLDGNQQQTNIKHVMRKCESLDSQSLIFHERPEDVPFSLEQSNNLGRSVH